MLVNMYAYIFTSMNNEKQYCGRCRKEKSIDQFNIGRGGCRQRNCQPCLDRMKELRDQKRCEHGKLSCKECKIKVCEHGTKKYICKICKGKGICEHDRQKIHCKDCKGSSICEHNKQRNFCKDCNGVSLCEHNRRKYRCKVCNGSSICEHGKVKYSCKKCDGSQFCAHGKEKHRCVDCDGVGICEHKRVQSHCIDCHGTQICKHNRIKHSCKPCGGKGICSHGKNRSSCIDCDPNGYWNGIIRSRVQKALRENKELSSKEYLQCDIDTLKSHLESQFVEGMTWDNYGEWQIDHIIPVKYKKNGKIPSLKTVIRRLHYKNLQPLWAKDNISKGNRYIG